MLLVGASFIFFFSWLLMLVTTLTFLLGGAVEVFACRHLVGFDDTAEKIAQVIKTSYLLEWTLNVQHSL